MLVVVSPAEFNDATKLPVILSITEGGAFARRIGFAVPIAGIKTAGVVLCDQPRVLDIAARVLGGRWMCCRPAIMDEVPAKVITIFEWMGGSHSVRHHS